MTSGLIFLKRMPNLGWGFSFSLNFHFFHFPCPHTWPYYIILWPHAQLRNFMLQYFLVNNVCSIFFLRKKYCNYIIFSSNRLHFLCFSLKIYILTSYLAAPRRVNPCTNSYSIQELPYGVLRKMYNKHNVLKKIGENVKTFLSNVI